MIWMVLWMACATPEPTPTSTDDTEEASDSVDRLRGDTACPPEEDYATDPDHCGGCGIRCEVPHAVAACVDGQCTIGTCEIGFASCDDDITTGCEHLVTCVAGEPCTASCGTAGQTSCADPCNQTCAPPHESCNVVDDDCDGLCDEDAGCRVGIHRSFSETDGFLYTDRLSEAEAWGTTTQNVFWVYVNEAPDTLPVYQCQAEGLGTWPSSDERCSDSGTSMGVIGQSAIRPEACAATPVYRLLHPDHGWTFMTADGAERRAAVADGYRSQQLDLWAWITP